MSTRRQSTRRQGRQSKMSRLMSRVRSGKITRADRAALRGMAARARRIKKENS